MVHRVGRPRFGAGTRLTGRIRSHPGHDIYLSDVEKCRPICLAERYRSDKLSHNQDYFGVRGNVVSDHEIIWSSDGLDDFRSSERRARPRSTQRNYLVPYVYLKVPSP